MRLNELKDIAGANKARTRVGRGIGSGLGKTAGRGVKGQKSRSGVAIKGFEGGQMPIHMRMPKRGFNNPFAKKFNALRLDRIEDAVKDKRLDARKVIDAVALVEAKVIRRVLDGVRLVAGFKAFSLEKVTFKVSHVSGGARTEIEAKGGKVETSVVKVVQDA